MKRDQPERLEADGLGILLTAAEAAAFLGRPVAGIHAVLRHKGIRPVHIYGVLILRRGHRAFYRLSDLRPLQGMPVSHPETPHGGVPGPEGGP